MAKLFGRQKLDTDNCNCLFNSPPVIANDVIVYEPAGGNYLLRVEYMELAQKQVKYCGNLKH